MKIIIINSRFFLSAGPEKYMFGLIRLLKKHGHEVVVFSTKNSKNEKSEFENYFADPIGGKDRVYYQDYEKDPATFFQIISREFYSNSVKKKLKDLIKETRPDVAYLLHHYNKLSPSVIDACSESKVPVVMRLSDFFLVCPESHLYANKLKDTCTRCIDGSLFNAIKYRCVKDSFAASALKASALLYHRMIKIYDKVAYVVSPSNFTKEVVSKRYDKDKIHVIPTFIELSEKYNPSVGDYALLVSRIEQHKGILTAIKAFEGTKNKLIIAGKSSSGYEKIITDYISSNKITNVTLAGEKNGEELWQLYRKSRFVIIPAEWYENMPNVALEAMLFSKPIIASDIGSLKEMIINEENGLLFKPKDFLDLRENSTRLFNEKKTCVLMGKNSYGFASKKYDPEEHYKQLIGLFNKAVKVKL